MNVWNKEKIVFAEFNLPFLMENNFFFLPFLYNFFQNEIEKTNFVMGYLCLCNFKTLNFYDENCCYNIR